VHQGPLYWEAVRKQKEKDKLPKDYYYNETMGKIKQNPVSTKFTSQSGSDNSYSMGDYPSAITPSGRSKSITTKRQYDFQKFLFPKIDPNPDLFLKSTEVDEEYEDSYYSEEDLVGEDAIDNYRYKHINMHRLREKEQVLGKQNKSPLIDYLIETDKEKLIPKTLGLVNRKHKPNEVVAGNYLFGEKYSHSFSEGIKNRTKLESLDLKKNRLTDFGFSEILFKAPSNLLVLDISYNSSLSMKTYERLADYLENPKTILQQLMIEGNQTGDKPVILLCKVLQYNNYLKYLNLSRNDLTNQSAVGISKMLKMNNKLNVLFLHWNKIREVGGKRI